MVLAEPLQITQVVASVFESLNIRYLIGGSLASSLYGIPRATQDVDIVAEIKYGDIPAIVNALQDSFYIDADMIREAIRYQRTFNIIHLGTMFKVDIFILKADSISQEEMSRRERYQISNDPESSLYLTSAEDIILHKLLWYQLSDKIYERQWTDVLGVIQVQYQNLDYSYLEQKAFQLNILPLLKKALAEVVEQIG